MSAIVVDASVAVKWVLDEEDADAALSLHGLDLTAPSLWLLEAASVLWRRSKTGEFSNARAEEMLADLHDAPIETTPLEEDLGTALAIANLIGHPVYDCLYLAAAIRLGTFVVTADKRFLTAARRSDFSNKVKLLAVDYPTGVELSS